jgi:RNA polymerase sigma factor (sigma-70 family)
MELSAGFGDQLDVSEVLKRKQALFEIMMAERGIAPSAWDDTLQEARIAAWRALGREHDTDAYVHQAARWRIGEVRDRQNWTGHTRRLGQPVDPLRRADTLSLDAILDVGLIMMAEEILDRVVLAYHHGEILQAICDLEPRQRAYVILRFWGGLPDSKIAAEVGRSKATLQRDWSLARRQLRTKLAHLAGAC